MSWAKIQSGIVSANGVSGTNTNAVTPGSNITTGNLLIAGASSQAVGTFGAYSISDAAGNVWTEQVTHVWTGDSVRTSIFSCPITVGGGTKPTVTVSASADQWGISLCVAEFSGLSTASGSGCVDVTATNDSGGTVTEAPASGTTAATGAAHELSVCIYGDFGWNYTITDSMNDLGNNSPNSNNMMVLSYFDSGASGGVQSGAWTTSGFVNYGAAIVVFKLAAVTTPLITKHFTRNPALRASNR